MKLKAVAGILITILMAFSHVAVWYLTKNSEQGKQAVAKLDLKDKEAERVKIVYKEKVKIEVKYRDRVKKIYLMEDPTGCLDTSLDAIGMFQQPGDNTGPVTAGEGSKERAETF